MKQVLENPRNGHVAVVDVAAPLCPAGCVLVQTRASLISAGTEASAVQFGQKSLLQKARSRPDLVRQVLKKLRTEGLRSTFRTVQSRLEAPLALGYSSAGRVLCVGAGVTAVKVGDRVACAGSGYASHAEIVSIPRNLVVPVPDRVTDQDAAFATVGAIALQGLRVADVRVGERIVVVGLGLIGLLSVQLLKSAGCLVLGCDINAGRVALARELGADAAYVLDPESVTTTVSAFTAGRGADAVIITAATRSNQPVVLAGEFARLKGRVVVLGDVRMDIPRRTYYEKELELRVSRSYGPGRYDSEYEERGVDYPYAYVPFTEQRNLEVFLQLVAAGRVTPELLVTHRFPIAEAQRAYGLLKGEVKEPYLGILVEYPERPDLSRKVEHPHPATAAPAPGTLGIGLIGAGNYTRQVLLPRLRTLNGTRLVGVSTARGVTALDAARRFGFSFSTTDNDEIAHNEGIHLVVVTTRHNTHAPLVVSALTAGKHVYVEKPLATDEQQLRSVIAAAGETSRHVMVGFNRRFAPLIQKVVAKLRDRSQPLAMFYRVNAGAIPASHWTQDQTEGAGRVIGEVCHFVDLLQFLCGSAPVSVFATSMRGATGGVPEQDVLTITLRFADGSIGTIHYFANGDAAVPKEYLEVYGSGRTFILNDFREARYAAGGKVERWRLWSQDKGQTQQLKAFVDAVRTGAPNPVPLAESVATTLTTFRVLDSLRSGKEASVTWGSAE